MRDRNRPQSNVVVATYEPAEWLAGESAWLQGVSSGGETMAYCPCGARPALRGAAQQSTPAYRPGTASSRQDGCRVLTLGI